MESIRPEDVGMTETEMREKQEEAYERIVARLVKTMDALNSAECGGGDAIQSVAVASLYIIAAMRNVCALREGLRRHMDDMAKDKNPRVLLAAMDSHKGFVRLDDALVSMFKYMIPQCLGGPSTKGTYTVFATIDEAARRSGWAFGEVEENGKKG